MDTIAQRYHRAAQCRVCFGEKTGLKAPIIGVAQPRWIGPQYHVARPRIVFIMLNPGAGDKSKDAGNREAGQILLRFRDGGKTFDEVLAFQRKHMKSWGRPPGRFLSFYTCNLGLNLDNVAFLNIALCATLGNQYPRCMLKQCFEDHTKGILQQLNPELVVLCGVSVRRFKSEIPACCPNTKVTHMLHHAHRNGQEMEKKEQARLRRIINALSGATA